MYNKLYVTTATRVGRVSLLNITTTTTITTYCTIMIYYYCTDTQPNTKILLYLHKTVHDDNCNRL